MLYKIEMSHWTDYETVLQYEVLLVCYFYYYLSLPMTKTLVLQCRHRETHMWFNRWNIDRFKHFGSVVCPQDLEIRHMVSRIGEFKQTARVLCFPPTHLYSASQAAGFLKSHILRRSYLRKAVSWLKHHSFSFFTFLCTKETNNE